jgi:hypothetical protein
MAEDKNIDMDKLHEVEKEEIGKEESPEFFKDAEKTIENTFTDQKMQKDILDFLNKK